MKHDLTFYHNSLKTIGYDGEETKLLLSIQEKQKKDEDFVHFIFRIETELESMEWSLSNISHVNKTDDGKYLFRGIFVSKNPKRELTISFQLDGMDKEEYGSAISSIIFLLDRGHWRLEYSNEYNPDCYD